MRIVKYMTDSKLRIAVVVVAVIISSCTNIVGTYFLKPLINDYIVPFIGQQDVNFAPFIGMLCVLGAIYLTGALCTYISNRLMVDISNHSLNSIRRDLFRHMQELPIRYFDTHTHGELMSRYTNDVDALREMLSNSMTALITSTITVVGTFTMMLILSPLLTLLIILMLLVMLFIIKTIGGRSARAFQRQQRALGAVNGYIEEMIEGQKVVKVFCHEETVQKDFKALNDELCNAATDANTFASILMPIMGNIYYIN